MIHTVYIAVWCSSFLPTCVGDDSTGCCCCCDWSTLPTLVGIADDGTADTVAVVTVLPLPLGLCPCKCDWSLCAVCCDVAVGDDEEFEVVATEFCCPPAAMEQAGPWGNWAGFDAPFGLELPLEGGAPDDVDRPSEFDLLGVELVGVVVLFPLDNDDDLGGRLEFVRVIFVGFRGDGTDVGGG